MIMPWERDDFFHMSPLCCRNYLLADDEYSKTTVTSISQEMKQHIVGLKIQTD